MLEGMDSMEEITVPSPADFHTHLRQGSLMQLVAPHVHLGGMRLAYVMVPSSSLAAITFANIAAAQSLSSRHDNLESR